MLPKTNFVTVFPYPLAERKKTALVIRIVASKRLKMSPVPVGFLDAYPFFKTQLSLKSLLKFSPIFFLF